MNAMLTWWGVSIAILEHQSLGNAVVERDTLLRVVPIFVAVLVWLIRVLIIGTFSVAGERLFSQANGAYVPRRSSLTVRPANTSTIRRPTPSTTQASFNPAPKGNHEPERTYARPEPTYHPVAMKSSASNQRQQAFQRRG